MKRLILLFCLLLSCSGAFATHIKGGFITYTKDQSLNPNPRRFVFTLTLFRDRASSAEDPEINISMGDGSSLTIPRKSVTIIDTDIERQTFEWDYTFGSDGNYTVAWNGINRNAKILNVAAPSDQLSFYIATTIAVNAQRGFNSSPQFLAPEPITGSIGVAINYNLLAYDPDGDSLSYKLVTPKYQDASFNILPVPGYSFPGKTYSCGATTGAPVSVFSLDSKTGQLVWDAACRQGEYAVAIVVEEWRKGQKIGEVTYDMQALTTFEPQSRILLQNYNSLRFTKEGHIVAKPKQELELKVYYSDLTPGYAPIPSDPAGPAVISNFASELTQLLNEPVSYTLEPAEYGTIATFRFTPDTTLIRNEPYFISFYGKKGAYRKTQSFGILVRSEMPDPEILKPATLTMTEKGEVVAVADKTVKLSMFAEYWAGYTLELSVHSPLSVGAEQFDFAVRDSTYGKVGELLFKPGPDQVSDDPQTITFMANYYPNGVAGGRRSSAAEPVTKEMQVQVIVTPKSPTATPEELAAATYLVYPNPAQDKFKVQAEAPATLRIYSLQGKVLLEQQLQPGTTEIKRPGNTSPGLYFYSLTTQKGHKKTGKLVLQ